MAGVLCEGNLRVQTGSRAEERYVVLFHNCLKYYTVHADYLASPEAERGCIVLSDIVCFDATDENIVLHLSRKKKTLGSSLPAGLRHWASALEKAGVQNNSRIVRRLFDRDAHLESPVSEFERTASPQRTHAASNKVDVEATKTVMCQGTLTFVGHEKALERHIVLFRKHIEYYNNAGEFERGDPPRGFYRLASIDSVDGEDQRFKLHFQNPRRCVELLASSARDAEAWLRLLRLLLHPKCRVSLFRGQSAVLLQPQLEERPVLEGTVQVVTKGRAEPHRLVCFLDRLEFFHTGRDATEAPAPRETTIWPEQVLEVVVLQDGFRFDLDSGTLTLRLDGHADLCRWARQLRAMFADPARASASPASGRPRALSADPGPLPGVAASLPASPPGRPRAAPAGPCRASASAPA
ncbi:unnamed protein product, partial [Prorocentrum cordatum]